MNHKHETERVSRLLSWEADVHHPPIPETRIEFPSWLDESDLAEALARVDDRGGTALPPGLVGRRSEPTPTPTPSAGTPRARRPAPESRRAPPAPRPAPPPAAAAPKAAPPPRVASPPPPRPAPAPRVAPPQGRPQPPRTLVQRPPAPAPRPPVRAARPRLQLLVRKCGEIVGRRTFAQDKVTIGRGKGCTLRLDDATVSRHHAQVVQRGGGFVLEDANSCNGVKVNGHLTERIRLTDRDVIALGEHELHVLLDRVPLDAEPEPEPEQNPALVEDDDDDEIDACLQTIFGRTARWRKREVFEADQSERSINARAYLRADPAAKRLWPRSCQVVLERDVFLIGGGEEADLRVAAFWVPRVAGVIVRGPAGYSLAPVSYWTAAVRLNGQPVWRVEPLENNDVITVAGQSLTFLLGMPSS